MLSKRNDNDVTVQTVCALVNDVDLLGFERAPATVGIVGVEAVGARRVLAAVFHSQLAHLQHTSSRHVTYVITACNIRHQGV